MALPHLVYNILLINYSSKYFHNCPQITTIVHFMIKAPKLVHMYTNVLWLFLYIGQPETMPMSSMTADPQMTSYSPELSPVNNFNHARS